MKRSTTSSHEHEARGGVNWQKNTKNPPVPILSSVLYLILIHLVFCIIGENVGKYTILCVFRGVLGCCGLAGGVVIMGAERKGIWLSS